MQKTTALRKRAVSRWERAAYCLNFTLVMKVSTCMILVVALSSNLLFAKRGISQRMEDKKITLELRNETLFNALKKIEGLSGFRIAYSTGLVARYKNISLAKATRSVANTLQQVLADTDFDFTQDENGIVIFKKVVRGVTELPLMSIVTESAGPGFPVQGRVVDSAGNPLWGASVSVKGTRRGTQTDNDGWFALEEITEGTELAVSNIGFFSQEIKVRKGIIIGAVLRHNPAAIADVTVVSTGYQTLPRERATGSFEVVDNKLFNRSVSPNLLDHLNSIASGVFFDNRSSARSGYTSYGNQGRTQTYTIRGIATITSNNSPLVIVDGFAYNSLDPNKLDINSINPADVESITVLKDAAAASIWGARAGNGVIVITTKSGKYNQKPTLSFTAGTMLTQKPRLFSQHILSTKDYIDLEKTLYGQGKYDAYYTNPFNNNAQPVSEVTQILFMVRAGTITQAEADARIQALYGVDVRNDYLKYLYQTGVTQQYNVNVKGGSNVHKYYVSAGYDNGKAVDFGYEKRITLNAVNTFMPARNLEITLPLTYTNNQLGNDKGSINAGSFSPYTRFTDANGNPQNVTYSGGYNSAYIQKAGLLGFYDMSYNPIKEFNADQYRRNNVFQILLSPSVKYVLPYGFTAEARYQYTKVSNTSRSYQSDSVYSVKNTINAYTQIGAANALSYPINRGGILSVDDSRQTNNNLRFTLSFNRNLGANHRLDALAGYERNESSITGNRNGWYGYNPATGVVQSTIDFVTQFPQSIYILTNSPYSFKSAVGIPNTNVTQQFLAYISRFANAAYTYKNRYTLSGSARLDQANLFGVKTNDKKKILWSAGGAWKIDQEPFYHATWLPQLKLRATYGYQGNTPSITIPSVATIRYSAGTNNSSGLPYASLVNIPNPNLRWEKVGQANLGLDFGVKNEIITGTLEYYQKKASDLVAPYTIDASTGATTRTGNVGNMQVKGMDVTINTKNITTPSFQWTSRILFSYNKDKLTNYLVSTTAYSVISAQAGSSFPNLGSPSPIVGNSLYGVYSLKWAGLDKDGNPQGYDTTGKISTNYTQLVQYARLQDMVYHGQANPLVFGSVMNTFTYKNLSLSVNITYKAGYYFHAQSLNYGSLLGGNMVSVSNGSSDYAKRWQQPGDENRTNVPSIPAAGASYLRDYFYQYSSALVQKGDNIRLRDISLTYDLGALPALKKSPFSSLQVYGYFTGDMILWKANKMGIDPDYSLMNPVKTYSFGIRASFK